MDGTQEAVPPHDHEAEMASLGSMLLAVGALTMGLERLTPEHFYTIAHRDIFCAMQTLHGRDEPLDVVTLRHQMERDGTFEKAGGTDYLLAVMESVPTSANAEYYFAILEDKRARRTLTALQAVARDSHRNEADIGALVAQTQDVLQRVGSGRDATPSLSDMLDAAEAVLEARSRGEDNRLSFGVTELDTVLGGLTPGHMCVVGALPGVGKTALATQCLAENAIIRRVPSVFFSIEMADAQVLANIQRQMAGIDYTATARGTFTGAQLAAWREAREYVEGAPLVVDTREVYVHELLPRAQQYVARVGMRLLVIDYLQLIRSKTEPKKHLAVAEAAEACKAVAHQLGVVVLVLSQVTMSDGHMQLRWAGEIKQAADMVLLLRRHEEYEREAADEPDQAVRRLLVDKNRHGPMHGATLTMDKPLLRLGAWTPRTASIVTQTQFDEGEDVADGVIPF